LITTDRISAWLNEPHHLQEVAPKALLQFAKEYPYFTPANYLLAISGRQSDAANPDLQQLHLTNPVLLHTLRELAGQVPEPEIATPLIPEIVAIETTAEMVKDIPEEITIIPVSAEDYFLQQGIHVSNDLPDADEMVHEEQTEEEKEKALMVVMSFAEWLKHISSHNKKAKEEEADKKALKTMWQQQKLAAAIEEENDEIPEQVFEMAVNSISRGDELVSESLAEVYAKQGKREKAIDMYQKLSLHNPEKNTYFAAKIENLQKDL
jgi:tetratricopeptide (TPR) repeat protein